MQTSILCHIYIKTKFVIMREETHTLRDPSSLWSSAVTERDITGGFISIILVLKLNRNLEGCLHNLFLFSYCLIHQLPMTLGCSLRCKPQHILSSSHGLIYWQYLKVEHLTSVQGSPIKNPTDISTLNIIRCPSQLCVRDSYCDIELIKKGKDLNFNSVHIFKWLY